MKLKLRTLSRLFAIASFSFLLAGCESPQKNPPKKQAKKTIVKQTKQVKRVTPKSDISYAWLGYPQPCLSPEDAKILVEKTVPMKVKPSTSFTYKITVTNRTKYTVNSIDVQEAIPDGYKFVSSIPAPKSSKGDLKWTISSLRPGAKKVISVTGKALKTGTIRYTGRTKLNFNIAEAQSVVNIVEPFLDFKIVYPAKVVISDIIPVKLVFRNTGKALLENCRLVHTLPRSLRTEEGRSKIEINVGDLKPGEQKEEKINLKANTTGIHSTAFIAMASEGISANAMLKVDVTKPNLIITAKAPKKRFVDNITPYTITVKNTGNAIAKAVKVKLSLSEGMKMSSATESGKVKNGAVYWTIPSLHPGETKRLTARAVAKKIMIVRATAEAEAVAADKVEAVMSTDGQGLAALVTELVDINDPVPVGENEIYEITAENTGSLPATKITIKCYLEDAMGYVQSTGATKGILKGKVLEFEALPSLEPKAKAKWRVTIKAKTPGDVRFAIKVESDQLKRPIDIDEATHFYE
jgi:uncharacterized repeat protein (TIGR01451 family)